MNSKIINHYLNFLLCSIFISFSSCASQIILNDQHSYESIQKELTNKLKDEIYLTTIDNTEYFGRFISFDSSAIYIENLSEDYAYDSTIPSKRIIKRKEVNSLKFISSNGLWGGLIGFVVGGIIVMKVTPLGDYTHSGLRPDYVKSFDIGAVMGTVVGIMIGNIIKSEKTFILKNID